MNQEIKGNISSAFKDFTTELNRAILDKAVQESKSQVPVTAEGKEASLSYVNEIHCKVKQD